MCDPATLTAIFSTAAGTTGATAGAVGATTGVVTAGTSAGIAAGAGVATGAAGMSLGTAAMVAGSAGSVLTGYKSYQEGKRASRAQQAIQARQERRAQIAQLRQQQMAQAQITARSQAGGTLESSGYSGSTSSVGSTVAGNIGFNSQISNIQQSIADSMSRQNRLGMYRQAFGGVARLGTMYNEMQANTTDT